MSHDNPYKPPVTVVDDVADARPITSIGLFHHIRAVAALMVVHGLLSLGYGVMMLVTLMYMDVMLKNNPAFKGGPGAPPPALMKNVLVATYGVTGGAGVITGALYLIAGAMNFFYRRRIFGIVALGGGLLSLATCYCGPTAVLLAIYGFVVYLNESVAAGFRYVEAGGTPEEFAAEVERRRASLRN